MQQKCLWQKMLFFYQVKTLNCMHLNFIICGNVGGSLDPPNLGKMTTDPHNKSRGVGKAI